MLTAWYSPKRRQKERTDSSELFSDFHVYVVHSCVTLFWGRREQTSEFVGILREVWMAVTKSGSCCRISWGGPGVRCREAQGAVL